MTSGAHKSIRIRITTRIRRRHEETASPDNNVAARERPQKSQVKPATAFVDEASCRRGRFLDVPGGVLQDTSDACNVRVELRVVTRMAGRSQAKRIVLIVVLAITLGIVLLIQLGGLPTGSGRGDTSGTPAQNGESPSVPGESTLAAPAKVQITWKRPEPIGPIARDPMRMDVQAASRAEAGAKREPNDLVHPLDQPKFLVTGIVFSSEQPSSVDPPPTT